MDPQRPLDALWQAVHAQVGPVRAWHLDDLLHHQPRYLANLAIVGALAPEGPILDVGAAPCHMTALLALSGWPVVGVDLEPARVAGWIGHFGLDVQRCDTEREPLPFADASFGAALLCETFEHLRIDPAFVLSEIHRVLAPGAPLLLSTPNVYSLPSLARFFTGRSIADPWHEFGKLRGIGHMGHVREYSAREVVRFLAGCGFVVQSVGFRSTSLGRGRRRHLLRLAYAIAPRRMRREIVVVARKAGRGLRLAPVVPLARGT